MELVIGRGYEVIVGSLKLSLNKCVLGLCKMKCTLQILGNLKSKGQVPLLDLPDTFLEFIWYYLKYGSIDGILEVYFYTVFCCDGTYYSHICFIYGFLSFEYVYVSIFSEYWACLCKCMCISEMSALGNYCFFYFLF